MGNTMERDAGSFRGKVINRLEERKENDEAGQKLSKWKIRMIGLQG